MKSSTMRKKKKKKQHEAQVVIPEAKWSLSNKLLMIVGSLTWVLGGRSVPGLMVEMEMKLYGRGWIGGWPTQHGQRFMISLRFKFQLGAARIITPSQSLFPILRLSVGKNCEGSIMKLAGLKRRIIKLLLKKFGRRKQFLGGSGI